jgi:membrane-bound lytic murein transglycosylase B
MAHFPSFQTARPAWLLVMIALQLGCLFPAVAIAQAPQTGFSVWLATLKQDALIAGIRQSTLDTALAKVKPLPWIIKADRNQPEFKKTLDKYLAGVLSSKRVQKGQRLLLEHSRLLTKISKKYDVQPRFIVALWGIETYYGRHTGKVPIIDALVTLAYDGRRSDYFRGELFNALKIIDAGHIGHARMVGSWAGAMGQVQFMPSSFLGYAVDGNADGRIDLWQTREDYLSSAANYLAKMGWQGNRNWGREVRVPKPFNKELLGLKQSASLRSWQSRGVRLSNGADLPDAGLSASLLQPEGAAGRSFLVYENYRTLMKWNRAHSFAIAVGLLADQLGAGR